MIPHDLPGDAGDQRIDDGACIVRGSGGRAGLPFATAYGTYRKL
jgi:hypothetical protein